MRLKHSKMNSRHRRLAAEAYNPAISRRVAMARLNVYIFHCSRCGEPAYALLKERTPGGVESGDTIFPTIDLKAIRAQCSACKHTQFRDAGENAHFALLEWN
jgi:predicted nucleic-acid-binding Zn-ribbon protein